MPLLTPPSRVARTGHTLLDLDKSLCHLGLAALLHRLLPALGRDYLVRILKPHMALTAPHSCHGGPKTCALHNLPPPAMACRLLLEHVPPMSVHFGALAYKWFTGT